MARPIGSLLPRSSQTPEQAFGKTLTQLRVHQQMTQEELGDRLGYHPSYIGQLERGTKSPTLRTLWNVAQLFGISVTALLGKTERELKRK